jgi:hypothetical protein
MKTGFNFFGQGTMLYYVILPNTVSGTFRSVLGRLRLCLFVTFLVNPKNKTLQNQSTKGTKDQPRFSVSVHLRALQDDCAAYYDRTRTDQDLKRL